MPGKKKRGDCHRSSASACKTDYPELSFIILLMRKYLMHSAIMNIPYPQNNCVQTGYKSQTYRYNRKNTLKYHNPLQIPSPLSNSNHPMHPNHDSSLSFRHHSQPWTTEYQSRLHEPGTVNYYLA
jgi:hypothetical protein